MPMTMAHSGGNASPAASSTDRPERSRNAKAQARHRAKRKAYIEQVRFVVVPRDGSKFSDPDASRP